MLRGLDALVFDFDGLLMDTESTLLECWRAEWRHHGLRLDETRFFADHGGDVTEQRYAELAAAVGPGYDRATSHARRVAYRDALHAGLGLAPGIRDWLDQAGGLGLRLAVASSSPRSWVEDHLARTGDLDRFTAAAYGDEVAGHKPDPAVYLLALHRLGVAPDRAAAFEDTPHGVAAARAAGLRCVAIPNRYADPSRFAAADLFLRAAVDAPLAKVLSALA
ncbi:HAD-IA family hydrolase [Dactylosporangium sp. NPDC000555]|uniref:HAD family hydrolase n=1 Tax=Dactylosporangium sp. NPDC000555 TaxID=3154260 RepID=UPI003322566B